MRRSFSLLAGALLIAQYSPAAFAQRAITGSVIDEQGGVIANATVRLEAVNGSAAQTTATDRDGRFRLNSFTAGQAMIATR